VSCDRSVQHFAPGRSDVEGLEVLLGGRGEGQEAEALRALLGGKGAGLHALAARGFDVPPGFTLSTQWCAAYYQAGRVLPGDLKGTITRAMEKLEGETGHKLGAAVDPLLVAVRSGAAHSMPGMMDTVLNVGSLEGIVEAVERVFLSYESERAVAYRKRKGLEHLQGTAVVVQEMCRAEAAGVAFTVDPAGGERVISVEAVEGLGDRLVSGEVTPERYRLRSEDLSVIEESAGDSPPVLSPARLREVASMALRVEEALGCPVDVEWAVAGGRTRLLQARAAAGAGTAEVTRARLRAEADRLREGAFLVRHNLDQTLSYPTPMTRDALKELFGPNGAYMALYRDLGFRPSKAVLEEGLLVILCGRFYADTQRTSELFYGTSVLAHDRNALRRRPELLDEPPTGFDGNAAGPLDLLQTLWRAARARRRLLRLREGFPQRFVAEVLPQYLAWCRGKADRDLSALDLPSLLDEVDERVEVAYRRFPREALKLSFLAAGAHAELRDLLERGLGEEEGREASRTLLGLLDGDPGLEQSRMLAALGSGEMAMEDFLKVHGHRSSGEMELARPRWREDPAAVSKMARSLGPAARAALDGRIEGRRRALEREEEIIRRRFEAAGGREAVADLETRLKLARELLPWRETWKHHWMQGVGLLRKALVEVDRRLGLEGGTFYLTRADLREIAENGGRVDRRHKESIGAARDLERLDRAIALPDCLTARDIEALAADGAAETDAGVDARSAEAVLRGAPLSPGWGEGRAWNAEVPGEGCPMGTPFVLVCPSTDPGWTPLLAQASAVVVERGGVLSHGAIVCRDFGIPAVGLPAATRRIKSGDHVQVDGTRGTVALGDTAKAGARIGRPSSGGAVPSVPQEPYVPPARPRLGSRAALGVAAAVAVSMVVITLPAARSALLPAVRAAFDWTIEAGWPPWRCIGFATLASAALAAAVQLAAGDRARLGRMRARLGWYRRQLREARKTGAAAVARTLEVRKQQASLERALELLRPVGWSFLPFCLALLWVLDRFSVEPIRPGTTFTVHAVFHPNPGNSYLRRACLESGDPERVRILDAPLQKLEPNRETPARGPYRASWSVQAVGGEGLVPLAVTTRDERLEGSVLISRRREFASGDLVRSRTSGVPQVAEVVSLEAEHPPLLVELPGPAFQLVKSIVRPFSAGRDITPHQAAMGPLASFLLCAVILALLLQRVTGMR